MTWAANLRARIARLTREAEGRTGTAERIAKADADAAEIKTRLEAAIVARQQHPAPRRELTDAELADFARRCPDAIGQAAVARARAERAEREAVRS